MPDYERLTDDEVLALANERQDLTVDAQAALDVELRRRSISPNDIQDYQAKTVQLNETEVRNIGVPTTFKGTPGENQLSIQCPLRLGRIRYHALVFIVTVSVVSPRSLSPASPAP